MRERPILFSGPLVRAGVTVVSDQPRREPSFRHHEVMIIGTFAQAVIELHEILNFVQGEWPMLETSWDDRAYSAARLAIHCAHMLELKEDCR